jgi:hypothetical protein
LQSGCGLKNARFGAVGARPAAFNTVRYSEKLLQLHGMSVTTVDFSEILGLANHLSDDDVKVKAKLDGLPVMPAPIKCPRSGLCAWRNWAWCWMTG